MAAVFDLAEEFAERPQFGRIVRRRGRFRFQPEEAQVAAGLAEPEQRGEHGHPGAVGARRFHRIADRRLAFAEDPAVNLGLAWGQVAVDDLLGAGWQFGGDRGLGAPEKMGPDPSLEPVEDPSRNDRKILR